MFIINKVGVKPLQTIFLIYLLMLKRNQKNTAIRAQWNEEQHRTQNNNRTLSSIRMDPDFNLISAIYASYILKMSSIEGESFILLKDVISFIMLGTN